MFLLCYETKSLVTPHPGSSSTYLGVCALVKLKSERFLSVQMALDSSLSDSKHCCLGCFCLVWMSEGRRQEAGQRRAFCPGGAIPSPGQ